jgi:hypothetical protein
MMARKLQQHPSTTHRPLGDNYIMPTLQHLSPQAIASIIAARQKAGLPISRELRARLDAPPDFTEAVVWPADDFTTQWAIWGKKGRETKVPRLILLIRHTEKPENRDNPNLSAVGERHAKELAISIPRQYGGAPDVVFAAATDEHAARCVETAQPIVDKYEIPLHSDILATSVVRLVSAIKGLDGAFVLVIWRHEQLPDIAMALGYAPPPFKS